MNLKDIKGIGEQLEKKLNKLDIYNVNDLIEYYPYKYNIYNIIDINNSNKDEVCMVNAKVVDEPRVFYIKKNFNKLSFKAISSNVIINVTIFNRAFLKQSLVINKNIVLIGKYDKYKNSFIASDIKYDIDNNTIEPIYHLNEGIKNKELIKVINESLKCYKCNEHLPSVYKNKYKLYDKNNYIKMIHNPKNKNDIVNALNYLKYEELFDFMFKINYLKQSNTKINGIKRNIDEKVINDFNNLLTFKLTKDQQKVINEIYNDLCNEKRMNRLVLGDVGSGKTIVATFAIYLNYLSGYQSALMAPTEILAEQHYNNIKPLLKRVNINVGLLTGSMKKKEKDIVLRELNDGKINLIIGTHALISDNVLFNNLGLVITDEQHRFGVGQRNTLRDKGNIPDVLYLSATPIPRTYALTIYGDLDISIIKEKPNGRKEIETHVVKESNIKDVLYKMLEEIKNGHQIYVVSPLIENSESDLKSVIYLKEKLDLAFNNKVKIDIIHGKLKQKEKDVIMDDFKKGITKILISTTVIEVGIDIKNATMMVIFNSERFGLATLHQLRGRIGRNDYQSYCYLISDLDIQRLKVMEESNDGFYISEQDYKMRGEGDLFGTKQSGYIPFKVVNLKNDMNILLQAKKDSEEYLNSEQYKNNNYYLELIDNINNMD